MPSSETPVYIVLGATGGIGSSLCRRLSEDGAKVVVGARTEETVGELAAEIGGVGLSVDATELNDVQLIIDHALSRFNRLDGIANCVGSILLKPAHLTSVDDYKETVAKNLDTAFYTVKAASRALYQSGGSIVLCASAVARTGLANHEAIAAAKAGIVGLTKSAAATYGSRNIRINCVAPGLVRTPLTAKLTSTEAAVKQSESMHALGRLGQPEDVAEAIHWLLDSSRSGWVTGQVIGVDGGLGTVRPR